MNWTGKSMAPAAAKSDWHLALPVSLSLVERNCSTYPRSGALFDGNSLFLFTLTGEEVPVRMESESCIEGEDLFVAFKYHHPGAGHPDLLHP